MFWIIISETRGTWSDFFNLLPSVYVYTTGEVVIMNDLVVDIWVSAV